VAAFEDYILGNISVLPVSEPRLSAEVVAMRRLVELDQYADFVFAYSPMLMRELLGVNVPERRRTIYQTLADSWAQSGEEIPIDLEERADQIQSSLRDLDIEDSDRRHLAEAIAINSNWLLTNDRRFVESCRVADIPLKVAYPSEWVQELPRGLFLR